jgi:two-component system, NtrC family, sensor kinase
MQQGRHRLLQRQLKRYVGDPNNIPVEWQPFIDAVNDAYQQADDDRNRMERTLELTSQELLQANTDLQQALQSVEQQVTDRTIELTHANESLENTLAQLQHTQTQLVQAEKMSSLGQVAAGIAHEINNPVTFIQGNLRHVNEYVQGLLQLTHQYQQDYPATTPQIQAILENLDVEFIAMDLPKILASMTVGTERITTIVQALRTFSRLDEAELKNISLKDSIESTVLILNSRLKLNNGDSIEINQEYINLAKIECYAGQFNQVLMNLIANSIDALKESSKFALYNQLSSSMPICGHNLLPQEVECLQYQQSPRIWIWAETIDAAKIEIRVMDNGVGIPEKIQSRIFDPFFTTKPVGKGTGMGLSTSHQIITKLHGGQLECRSRPGWGTVFAIQVPIHQSCSKLTPKC